MFCLVLAWLRPWRGAAEVVVAFVVAAALEEEVAAAITSVVLLRLRLSGSPQPQRQPRNGWLNPLIPLSGLHRSRNRVQ